MTFAKIDPNQTTNIIVDIQILQSTDIQDPNFIWVDITNYNPQPDIGWITTDNINFINPIPGPTLQQAIQGNLIEFQGAVQNFVDTHYNLEIRFNFMALYTLSVQNSLTNRAAYITQLFTWAESVVTYCAIYVSIVEAMTTVSEVEASTWDFTQIATDPMITTNAAIAITN